MEEDYLIKVKDLKEHFKINDDFIIKAVDGVSFGIKKNEIFGLVGESGCGKSTLARCIANIYNSTSGEVYYKNRLISGKKLIRKTWHYLKEKCSSFFRIQVLRLIRV